MWFDFPEVGIDLLHSVHIFLSGFFDADLIRYSIQNSGGNEGRDQ